MPYANVEDRRRKRKERYHEKPLEDRQAEAKERYTLRKQKLAEWYQANAEKRREYRRNYYAQNRDKILAQCKQWIKANPGHRGRSHLKTRYGITYAEKEALLKSQNDQCAICKTTNPGRQWHIDHCHKTGRVRGILCFACNTGLGAFRDNTTALTEAIKYLENADATNPCVGQAQDDCGSDVTSTEEHLPECQGSNPAR